MVCIGNFLLLNLFVAILLVSFEQQSSQNRAIREAQKIRLEEEELRKTEIAEAKKLGLQDMRKADYARRLRMIYDRIREMEDGPDAGRKKAQVASSRSAHGAVASSTSKRAFSFMGKLNPVGGMMGAIQEVDEDEEEYIPKNFPRSSMRRGAVKPTGFVDDGPKKKKKSGMEKKPKVVQKFFRLKARSEVTMRVKLRRCRRRVLIFKRISLGQRAFMLFGYKGLDEILDQIRGIHKDVDDSDDGPPDLKVRSSAFVIIPKTSSSQGNYSLRTHCNRIMITTFLT